MAIMRSVQRDLGEVQAEIRARIDQLDRDFRLLSVGELGRRADAIRQLAYGSGLAAVGGLAAGLSEALAKGGRAVTVRPFLDGMRDAVGIDRHDEASASHYLAAVGVRLPG